MSKDGGISVEKWKQACWSLRREQNENLKLWERSDDSGKGKLMTSIERSI